MAIGRRARRIMRLYYYHKVFHCIFPFLGLEDASPTLKNIELAQKNSSSTYNTWAGGHPPKFLQGPMLLDLAALG